MFRIIWPDSKLVSAETITGWYSDAVANGDCDAGLTDVSDMALALDDAGLITICK